MYSFIDTVEKYSLALPTWHATWGLTQESNRIGKSIFYGLLVFFYFAIVSLNLSLLSSKSLQAHNCPVKNLICTIAD